MGLKKGSILQNSAESIMLAALFLHPATTDVTTRGYTPPALVPTISSAVAAARAAAIAAAPGEHMLLPGPRTFYDQQKVPCCVSCALASAMEALNPSWPRLAALFHYYVCNFERGLGDPNGSLPLGSATITPLGVEGVCESVDYPVPFTIAGASTPPSQVAFDDAKMHRLAGDGSSLRFRRLTGTSIAAAVRDALNQEHPVVIGFTLPVGYPDRFLDSSYAWNDPMIARDTGGHCVTAVGFSDARSAVRIHDCQGASAFDRGRWWMGYRILDSTFVGDAFSLG